MIVCGTDFSNGAAQALAAAAALASLCKLPLRAVHVMDSSDDPERERRTAGLRRRLEQQAKEIEDRSGVRVDHELVAGDPDRKLVEYASSHMASLIVIAATGDRPRSEWLLGSVAERVAQTSTVPVFIVRESASVEAWARGRATLRTVVGVEIGSTSKAALRWAANLRSLGKAEVLPVHVAWPPAEHARVGLPGPVPFDSLRSELETVLIRDLREWARDVADDLTFTVCPGWGRVDVHLAQVARENNADLLVVGTHQRAAVARLWQGSVSRGALHQAGCNVVCVPANGVDSAAVARFRRVLIPTDFSPFADRAIAVGYGAVADFGTVYLLHVMNGQDGKDAAQLEARLRERIPSGVSGRGILTEIHVVSDESAWAGIWHWTGRLGADAVCMATHGRSGVLEVVLGSQAREVLARASRPVILVPPPKKDGF